MPDLTNIPDAVLHDLAASPADLWDEIVTRHMANARGTSYADLYDLEHKLMAMTRAEKVKFASERFGAPQATSATVAADIPQIHAREQESRTVGNLYATGLGSSEPSRGETLENWSKRARALAREEGISIASAMSRLARQDPKGHEQAIKNSARPRSQIERANKADSVEEARRTLRGGI